MATQVPDITTLRKQAVQLLCKEDRSMTTSEIALALALPYWATDAAMEHAYLAREATFEAGVGWSANQSRQTLEEARAHSDQEALL